MASESELRAKASLLRQQLAGVNLEIQQLERSKLPEVTVGSHWKSELMVGTYLRVDRIEFGVASCTNIVLRYDRDDMDNITSSTTSITLNHEVAVKEFTPFALKPCGLEEYLEVIEGIRDLLRKTTGG